MAENIEIVITGKDEFSGVAGVVQDALHGIGNVALTVAAAGVAALGAAFVGTGAILKSSVDEAMASQDALAELDAVLRSTGGSAGVTRDQVLKLAEAFQQETRFSDEAIISGQSMLLTFTNIGSDVFPLATQAMIDLGEKMGRDLPGAAIMLGKALNEPITGVTALRRVGVMLTEEQEEQIKKFVEVGDVASAQAIILNELAVEFGGVAQAAGSTFGGQLEIAKNKISDLKETIGNALLPHLQKVLEWFSTFIDSPAVKAFIDQIADDIGRTFQNIANWLVEVFENPSTQAAIERFGELIHAVFNSLAMLTEAGPFSSEFGESLTLFFGEENQQKIFDMQEAIEGFITRVSTAFKEGGFAGVWDEVFGSLGGSSEFANMLQSVIDSLTSAMEGVDWTRVGQVIANIVTGAIELVLQGLDVIVNRVDWGPFGRALSSAIGEMFRGVFGNIADYVYLDNWIAFFKQQLPSAIVQGLTGGILNGFGDVAIAFGTFVSRVITLVKSLFGVGSPSTIFSGIGRDLVAGLLLGWQLAWGGFLGFVTGSLTTLLSGIATVLGSAAGQISGVFGGGAVGSRDMTGDTHTRTGTDVITGHSTGGGLATTSSGAGVTNNYYGPVYFQGAGEPGAYYDCPSSTPLTNTGGMVHNQPR